MKKLFPVFMSFVLLGFAGQAAFGCSCAIESETKKIDYKKWQRNFDGAAFKGRVVNIEEDKENFELKVTFAVESYWRGVEGTEAVIFTARESSMCGVMYEIGEERTVIAYRGGDELRTNICTEMQYQANLKSYLKALGKVRKSAPAPSPSHAADQRSRPFDVMANPNCESELASLDAFAKALQDNPGSMAFLIAYGGRKGKKDEAKARLARMSYYLSEIRGAGKPIIDDGGFNESLTVELWIYFPGELIPKPRPSVKAEDVKLKGKEEIRGYNCADEMGT